MLSAKALRLLLVFLSEPRVERRDKDEMKKREAGPSGIESLEISSFNTFEKRESSYLQPRPGRQREVELAFNERNGWIAQKSGGATGVLNPNEIVIA